MACDLLVFCTPVDQIVPGVALISEACQPGTLITDVGSTKASLCDELYELAGERVEFVGSHPIAGSDKQGAEHGRADLFQNRVCVVTPRSNNTAEAVDRVGSFWQSLGMRVATMSPAEHDETLAVTSHLPHLAAAAVAQLLEPRLAAFAASGFRDTTRIALGDPALWTAIFLTNRGPVLESLAALLDVLQHYRRAIDSGDERQLQRLLSEAQYHRQKLV